MWETRATELFSSTLLGAAMIDNSKRREVAAKLRGNPEDTHIPHRTGRHYGMGCHEAADRFWNMCYRIREAGNYDIAFNTTSVLADLIDPSVPSDPGEAGLACVDAFIREHTEKPVDREALLALADELDERHRWCCGGDAVHAKDCAERIREALGVES